MVEAPSLSFLSRSGCAVDGLCALLDELTVRVRGSGIVLISWEGKYEAAFDANEIIGRFETDGDLGGGRGLYDDDDSSIVPGTVDIDRRWLRDLADDEGKC